MQYVSKILACTAFCGALAFPVAASAQSDSPQTTDDIIVTASGETQAEAGSKTGTSLIETPQAVSVVTRDEMDVRAVHTVTDAVAYTAGVQSEQGGIDNRVDDFTIRGFDSGSFSDSQFLDGMRIPTGGQWTRVAFEQYGLEQIEILKGPSAVLFGQVAPGGLVNMVSKRPKSTFGAEIGFQAAGFADLDRWQYTAQADITGPLSRDGSLSARLVGMAKYGDTQIDLVSSGRYYIAPSLKWDIGSRTSLTIMAQYQRDEGESSYQFLPSIGTLVPTPQGRYLDLTAYIGEPDFNSFDRDQYSISYDFTHRFSDALSFHSKGRYIHLNTFYEVTVLGLDLITNCAAPGSPAGCVAGQTIARRAVDGIGATDGWSFDNNLVADFATGTIKHTFLLGFDFQQNDWYHNRRAASSTPPLLNVFNPVYAGSASIRATLAPQIYNAQNDRQAAIYAQEQMSIGDLRLMVSGRYDWAKIDLDNTAPTAMAGNGGQPVAISRVDAEKFTWRAGAVYLTDSGFAPYVSYAKSFQPIAGVNYRGEAFVPTEGEQYEAGIKYQPPGVQAFVTLAAYDLKQKNRVTADFANFPNRTNNAFCGINSCSAQTGEVRIRGVELEGKASFPWGLTFVGTLTYMDGKITKSNTIISGTRTQQGNDLDQVPNWMGSIFADYRFRGPLDGVGIGGGIRYVGENYGDPNNEFLIPEYTLFDAFLRYQFDSGITLSLNGRNLANKRYVATCAGATQCFYGSGRTVNLRAQFRF